MGNACQNPSQQPEYVCTVASARRIHGLQPVDSNPAAARLDLLNMKNSLNCLNEFAKTPDSTQRSQNTTATTLLNTRNTANRVSFGNMMPQTLASDDQEQPSEGLEMLEGEIGGYKKIGILGSGAYGLVYKVESKTGECFAMKKIDKGAAKINPFNLLLEKRVMLGVDSPFVIKLHDSFQDESYCYMVMELATGGDVFSMISKSEAPHKRAYFKNTGEEGVRFILASVVMALEALHKQNILYRDLKPENVLLFSDGYAKLCDFGLSAKISDNLDGQIAGTKMYFAPQVVEDKKYTKYTQLWCLGVFLHELVYFTSPFPATAMVKGSFRLIASQREINKPWRSGSASEQVKDLIDKLLRVDSNNRIGANGLHQIKQHLFFSGFDWASLEDRTMKSPFAEMVNLYPSKISLKGEQISKNIVSSKMPFVPGFRSIQSKDCGSLNTSMNTSMQTTIY